MTTQQHTNSQRQTDELRLDAVVLRDLDLSGDSADQVNGGTRTSAPASGRYTNCTC